VLIRFADGTLTTHTVSLSRRQATPCSPPDGIVRTPRRSTSPPIDGLAKTPRLWDHERDEPQLTEQSATRRDQRIGQRIRFRSALSKLPKKSGGFSGVARSVNKAGFREDIEGLRAVAVLAVVLFHAGVPGVGGGFVGVDVFFVISGFLITGMLWREVSSSGTVRLRRFYGARARRLLPASATVGVLTAIASAVLLPPLQAENVLIDGIANALYVGNYLFALQGVDYHLANTPPSPFLHYWSLGVEEQFYLVWPPMIIVTALLIRRVRRRRTGANATPSVRPYLVVLVLVGVVSFVLSLAATVVVPSVAFYSLPTRAWELAAGGLVGLTAAHWRRLPAPLVAIAAWGGLALILLACAVLSATTPFPGTAALLPVLGTALVIGAGCAAPAGGVGRILSLPPMRAVGRASYSWYLWHWPVLVLAAPLLGHSLGLAGRLVTVLLSGVLAVITLHVIENPFRFADSLRRSPARSLAVGGAATAVAVCVSVVCLVLVPIPVGHGPAAPPLAVSATPPPTGPNPDPYDAAVQHAFAQVQAAVSASADRTAVPSNLDPSLTDVNAQSPLTYFKGCLRNFFEVDQPECVTGDTGSPTKVALVGDSNAAMWIPTFRQLAEERPWQVETLAKGGCPMLDLAIINPFLRREYTECKQWRDLIIERLRTERPQLIVLGMWRKYGDRYDFPAGVTSYDPTWTDSLTRLVQELRGIGSQVLVLGPIPDPHTEVPVCLSGHLDDALACSPTRSKAVNEPGIVAEADAVIRGGGQYADITNLFCTADRCPVIVGNTVVFRDANHLSFQYAQLLAPAIGALADRALARTSPAR
jgi:peptidoglycan/LPS O-acetylase OafA/YrhL